MGTTPKEERISSTTLTLQKKLKRRKEGSKESKLDVPNQSCTESTPGKDKALELPGQLSKNPPKGFKRGTKKLQEKYGTHGAREAKGG
jgi:hypothetical protein